MAKYKGGILSTPRGRIGDKLFYTRKGVGVVQSMGKRIGNKFLNVWNMEQYIDLFSMYVWASISDFQRNNWATLSGFTGNGRKRMKDYWRVQLLTSGAKTLTGTLRANIELTTILYLLANYRASDNKLIINVNGESYGLPKQEMKSWSVFVARSNQATFQVINGNVSNWDIPLEISLPIEGSLTECLLGINFWNNTNQTGTVLVRANIDKSERRF